jgi:hypothetical protein
MTDNSTKQGRTTKIIILSIIFALLVSALFIYLTVYLPFKKTYIDPYEQFREMELQALPQFDSLNEQIYQELPEPLADFEFLEKTSYGIENAWYIGRWMMVSFRGKENTEDEFFEYYGTNLLNNNWSLRREDEFQLRSASYYKGTSCVELSVNQPRYFIRIWQDFEDQPFVSEMPSASVLGSHLYDSWIIATCP